MALSFVFVCFSLRMIALVSGEHRWCLADGRSTRAGTSFLAAFHLEGPFDNFVFTVRY